MIKQTLRKTPVFVLRVLGQQNLTLVIKNYPSSRKFSFHNFLKRAREDSNLQSRDPESRALSIEPRAHHRNISLISFLKDFFSKNLIFHPAVAPRHHARANRSFFIFPGLIGLFVFGNAISGGGEIRTHGNIAATPLFESGAVQPLGYPTSIGRP